MKRLFLLLLGLLFLICTFHSCVQVHIGERIRQGGERCTGVQANSPEGGVVYRLSTAKGEGDRFFVRAAEVTYRPASPWVTAKDSPLSRLLDLPGAYDPAPAGDVRPTGRVLLVECDRAWGVLHPQAVVEALPPGARSEPVARELALAPANTDTLGGFGTTEEAGTWRILAAAPFDYLLDPVLGGVAGTVDGVFSALFMLYWIPHFFITGDSHPPL